MSECMRLKIEPNTGQVGCVPWLGRASVDLISLCQHQPIFLLTSVFSVLFFVLKEKKSEFFSVCFVLPLLMCSESGYYCIINIIQMVLAYLNCLRNSQCFIQLFLLPGSILNS
jgi:hypothetical protein